MLLGSFCAAAFVGKEGEDGEEPQPLRCFTNKHHRRTRPALKGLSDQNFDSKFGRTVAHGWITRQRTVAHGWITRQRTVAHGWITRQRTVAHGYIWRGRTVVQGTAPPLRTAVTTCLPPHTSSVLVLSAGSGPLCYSIGAGDFCGCCCKHKVFHESSVKREQKVLRTSSQNGTTKRWEPKREERGLERGERKSAIAQQIATNQQNKSADPVSPKIATSHLDLISRAPKIPFPLVDINPTYLRLFRKIHPRHLCDP